MESGPPLDAARAEAPTMTVSKRINEELSVRNSGFSREPRNQNCTSRKERIKILEAFQKNKETKSVILGRTENIISIHPRIVDSWIQFQTSKNPTHSQMHILSFLCCKLPIQQPKVSFDSSSMHITCNFDRTRSTGESEYEGGTDLHQRRRARTRLNWLAVSPVPHAPNLA
jgi:hypothetical protein